MLTHVILVAHIVVLGYWLGAEFVINSTYRYVSYRSEMPFADRDRLMSHVLDVDQHVRYALVLQFGLGAILAARLGYFAVEPEGTVLIALLALVWLAFVEAVHRLRHRRLGQRLAKLDRGMRYGLMVGLVVVGTSTLLRLFPDWNVPNWLGWKLLFFAGVLACGVGIRIQIIRFFQIWKQIAALGSDEDAEQSIRRVYVRATSILVGLWVFIFAMVVMSVVKPG